jgi:hypothetical protein
VQQTSAQPISRSAVKRAVTFSEPAARKIVLHADITALMAIRPNNKDWQTVFKKVAWP